MIKNFEEYINEDYFSKLASRKDSNDVRKENGVTEDFVRSFIQDSNERYVRSISFRKENDKTVVDVDCDIFYLNKSTKEIPFQFGKVTGSFNCSYCNLTSLKGCPEEVGGNFICNHCDNLTSLEGCPIKISGTFICSGCDNLTSLEGCPREVGDGFYCIGCGKIFTKEKIKSLCNIKGRILV